ncbi:MAG: hypothetical protein LBJ12_09235 [Oscillospiraceae bacterium]|jgi:hypothetical protein|nr:hypothetical protein [Oscillospiraceae bacterium]
MSGVLNFSEYIDDAVRLLIIIEALNRIKPTQKVTETRIKLFDYYLKFPHTMFDESIAVDGIKSNFDEYYAFFHWKPDVVKYRGSLNFLIAKGFVEKRLEDTNLFFTICPQGAEALSKMKSGYKQRLTSLAELAIPLISKLTDKKIEEEIMKKANLLSRESGGLTDEN